MRLDGDELEMHYRYVLESLGRVKGRSAPAVTLENGAEESKIANGDAKAANMRRCDGTSGFQMRR
jgi:hypothetical protein